MKQKIYILGIVTSLIIFLGAIFKVNHWAGASVLLILGISVLVLVFLPVSLNSNYKEEGSRQNFVLYFVTWITCLIIFTAMLFKIMHWSGAGVALFISLPFPYLVFLPVFLVITSRNKKFSIRNTVAVLFLLVLISSFTALLALDVSKERIKYSLELGHHYTISGKTLADLNPENKSALSDNIDKACNTIEEFEGIYFRSYGITRDQWEKDPDIYFAKGGNRISDSKTQKLSREIQERLLAELSDIMTLIENNPGQKELAGSAPSILGISKAEDGNYKWFPDPITDYIQPWSLIYLEGLANSLLLLKEAT